MGKLSLMDDVQTASCFSNFQFADELGETYFTDKYGRKRDRIIDKLGIDHLDLFQQAIDKHLEALELQQEAQALRSQISEQAAAAGTHRFGAAAAAATSSADANAAAASSDGGGGHGAEDAAGAGVGGAHAAPPGTFRLVLGK